MKISYDFHIHSALSPCADNDMTPCNIVGMAMLKGLNAIAVTDHNSVGNAKAVIKAGKENGITVIPGMEIETSEEVHILTLYPDIDSAVEAEKYVTSNLPFVKNKPEIFGNQYYMDSEDNITGELEQLLIVASNLDIYSVFDMVSQCKGVAIPAHVDRHSYSVLSNLGFIPPDLKVPVIEVSNNVADLNEYLNNTRLTDKRVLRNSDAHNLGIISEPINYLDVLDCNVCNILKKLME